MNRLSREILFVLNSEARNYLRLFQPNALEGPMAWVAEMTMFHGDHVQKLRSPISQNPNEALAQLEVQLVKRGSHGLPHTNDDRP
jgi:hypothetical protein